MKERTCLSPFTSVGPKMTQGLSLSCLSQKTPCMRKKVTEFNKRCHLYLLCSQSKTTFVLYCFHARVNLIISSKLHLHMHISAQFLSVSKARLTLLHFTFFRTVIFTLSLSSSTPSETISS